MLYKIKILRFFKFNAILIFQDNAQHNDSLKKLLSTSKSEIEMIVKTRMETLRINQSYRRKFLNFL